MRSCTLIWLANTICPRLPSADCDGGAGRSPDGFIRNRRPLSYSPMRAPPLRSDAHTAGCSAQRIAERLIRRIPGGAARGPAYCLGSHRLQIRYTLSRSAMQPYGTYVRAAERSPTTACLATQAAKTTPQPARAPPGGVGFRPGRGGAASSPGDAERRGTSNPGVRSDRDWR
jgi:hypothetical protein